MSWSISISPTARDDFAEAVDAAEVVGQSVELPGVAEATDDARAALKSLATHIKRPRITATAGGHVLQEGEGSTYYEACNVSVVGVDEEPTS
jgi:hypothetical protein